MTYSASQIKVLEGLDPVRKRPGMYIGDTGRAGLHHCIYEIVDNSGDEHLAGNCSQIDVTLHPDQSIEVCDDGRGIPVDIHPQKLIPTVTLVLTVLHAGGKFENESGGSAYKTSGGLHGVGASVVNALSSKFEVQVTRDGGIFEQTFKCGVPTTDLVRVGDSKGHGTRVRFWPDMTIFKDEEGPVEFDAAQIAKSLKMRAYLNPGLTIKFTCPQAQIDDTYKADSFASILDTIVPEGVTKVLATPLLFVNEEETTEGPIEAKVAMTVCSGRAGSILSFANNINTPQGGTHDQGFRTAYLRAMNRYCEQGEMLKEPLTSEDVREGLFCAISVNLISPRFSGQTKDKLSNTVVSGVVSKTVYQGISRWLEENPKEAKQLIARAKLAQAARLASDKARAHVERDTPLSGIGTLPGKLADCQTNDPAMAELFIVEGDSAGGSAKQGRDRKFQAILPLKGKPLNVWRADPAQVLNNAEIAAILVAIGATMGPDGKARLEKGKLRYHKIINMTDADVDGSHIMTLLLTVFHQVAPSLISGGHIFVAQPPLYRAKKGTQHHWISDDAALEVFRREKGDGWEVQRFKGLGEMNPQELWETTMDPATRSLIRISYPKTDNLVTTIDEPQETTPIREIGSGNCAQCPAQAEHDAVFEMLMGNEVEPRRVFVEENAQFATIDL